MLHVHLFWGKRNDHLNRNIIVMLNIKYITIGLLLDESGCMDHDDFDYDYILYIVMYSMKYTILSSELKVCFVGVCI